MSKVKDTILEEQEEIMKNLVANYEEFQALKEKYERELFVMVYKWGSLGVVVTEKCNAFQEKLKQLEEINKLL